MGTNFYLHQKAKCECCGRAYEPLHIGKSSVGWAFALHVMPEDGINTLEDWVQLWSAEGACILDQYGQRLTHESMLSWITERSWHGGDLIHAQIDTRCIGHGPGTWDYIVGEFS